MMDKSDRYSKKQEATRAEVGASRLFRMNGHLLSKNVDKTVKYGFLFVFVHILSGERDAFSL